MPQLPMTLFADYAVVSPVFEQVILLENPILKSGDKIQGLQRTPYERTLYLDTDIYLVSDISDIFNLLSVFDIALAHDPGRRNLNYPQWDRVPYAFSQFNSGVLAFRCSPLMDDLLATWYRLYHEFASAVDPSQVRDQPALREALYFSEARIATLPPEYNFRPWIPAYFHGEVKLLHGRSPRMGAFASIVNQRMHSRVVIFKNERPIIYDNTTSRWYRITKSLKRYWKPFKKRVLNAR